ncbi:MULTISPECIES: DUF4189 domain-containing protein [Luteibacter]|uniref:DUF4189 domain-containing protein n=1 Tax=Luteibacter TaxID=242605 RepID=UPI0009DCD8EB
MKQALPFLLFACAYASSAWSQCAPGIPGAGNPGCIPPTAPNSPYSQGSDSGASGIQSVGPQPVWEETWGAFAMDDVTGEAGTVENRQSRSEAERLAVETCARGGGVKCEVIFAFHNQCAAFTQKINGGGLNWDTGESTGVAEQRALSACRGTCQVIYSKCTVPRRVN